MGNALASTERIAQRGSFRLDLPPAEAFKLFTAAGERLWVPGWSPTMLGTLPQHSGLVFTTGVGAEHTIWTVIDSDAAAGRVRYSRVTPGSRAGVVAVEIVPEGGGSLIDVSYDLTALTPEGAEALQAYSPAAFARMMQDWQGLILAMSSDARTRLASLVV